MVDFPEAWKISDSVPDKNHHPDCSVNHGMLCDCEVLMTHPRYIEDYGDEISWKPGGEWKNGKWIVNGKWAVFD